MGLSRRSCSISRSPSGRLRRRRLILEAADVDAEGGNGCSNTRVAVSSEPSMISSSSGCRWYVLYGDAGRALGRVLGEALGRSGITGPEPSSIVGPSYWDDLLVVAWVVEMYGRGVVGKVGRRVTEDGLRDPSYIFVPINLI